jgi:hypothetical protein
MNTELILQIGISILSGNAILWAYSDDVRLTRYAPIVGMLGQPFWFASAYMHGQWAIALLSVLYAVAWGAGIKRHWLSNLPARQDLESTFVVGHRKFPPGSRVRDVQDAVNLLHKDYLQHKHALRERTHDDY